MINNRFMVFRSFLSCKGMKYNSDTQLLNHTMQSCGSVRGWVELFLKKLYNKNRIWNEHRYSLNNPNFALKPEKYTSYPAAAARLHRVVNKNNRKSQAEMLGFLGL